MALHFVGANVSALHLSVRSRSNSRTGPSYKYLGIHPPVKEKKEKHRVIGAPPFS